MILIVGGRYGSAASEPWRSSDGNSFNSITKSEYLEALSAGIPIFTFIRQSVLNEYFTYINQPKNKRKDFRPSAVDNVLVYHLIKEIRELRSNNLIIEYGSASEILQYLKKATASLVHDAFKSRRDEVYGQSCLINGYKLFYYRRTRGLSHTQLGQAIQVKRAFISSLEKVRSPEALAKHGQLFRECPRSVLTKLEAVLDCHGELEAGKEDGVLSVYISYYHSNRGKQPNKDNGSNDSQELFPIKSVIFDFDGTLTHQDRRTTWELIWEELGYSIENCAKLHRDFSNNAIDHREWCERTCDAFNDKGISEATLNNVAARIKLMDGVRELIEILADNEIEMHILSGSIEQVIYRVLGPLAAKFTHIQANSFKFSGSVLSYIQGTDYDFEGKATYVLNLLERKKWSPTDILFVGNSSNDRWVSRAGVTTLCVNPHFTDGNDEREWIYCIREMHDIREILKFIRLPSP